MKKLIVLSLLLVTALTGSIAARADDLTLGVQTYTLRNLDFDQVVDFAVKHKLKYLEMISKHIDPMGPHAEAQRKKEILEKNGLVCYTFGVAGTSMKKEENRKLFEFAKFMGCKLIVVEPSDFAIFDNLEELVKEYDIKLAIHNHGIKSLYGNPAVVQNVIKHRDPRIGVCLDVGWATSSRLDAAKTFRAYGGRVYDIHLKDKKVRCTDKGDVATDVFIGEGDTDFKALFKVMKEMNYNGVLAIETDNDLKDPTEHMEKAIHFFEENAK